MKHGVKLPGTENDAPTRLQDFETLCGRRADLVLVFLSGEAWSSSTGQFLAADYHRPRYAKLDREVLWTVPLIPMKDIAAAKSNVAEVMSGRRDTEFVRCANSLAQIPGTDPIYLRLGHESNGNWYAWGTPNIGAGAYRDLFHHVATLFRRVSTRFKFVYNVSALATDTLESAYPGDAVVDVVSVDVYWQPQWQGADPAQAWEKVTTGTAGLNDTYGLSVAHGKPFAIDEWGAANGGEAFVAKFAEWISNANPLVLNSPPSILWECYWHSNASYMGMLDFKANSSTLAWIQAFGGYALHQAKLLSLVRQSVYDQAVELDTARARIKQLEGAVDSLKTEVTALRNEKEVLETEAFAMKTEIERYVQVREIFKSFLS